MPPSATVWPTDVVIKSLCTTVEPYHCVRNELQQARVNRIVVGWVYKRVNMITKVKVSKKSISVFVLLSLGTQASKRNEATQLYSKQPLTF